MPEGSAALLGGGLNQFLEHSDAMWSADPNWLEIVAADLLWALNTSSWNVFLVAYKQILKTYWWRDVLYGLEIIYSLISALDARIY